MNRNRLALFAMLSMAGLVLPSKLTAPDERTHLTRRSRSSRGPSTGRFRELLREAMRMRLERPAKWALESDLLVLSNEWRKARNRRKAAKQREARS